MQTQSPCLHKILISFLFSSRNPHIFRYRLQVRGSGDNSFTEGIGRKMARLGRAIAEHDCILITGGCPGLSCAAVQGATAPNGFVVGNFACTLTGRTRK